jgi:hypothetical protein
VRACDDVPISLPFGKKFGATDRDKIRTVSFFFLMARSMSRSDIFFYLPLSKGPTPKKAGRQKKTDRQAKMRAHMAHYWMALFGAVTNDETGGYFFVASKLVGPSPHRLPCRLFRPPRGADRPPRGLDLFSFFSPQICFYLSHLGSSSSFGAP